MPGKHSDFSQFNKAGRKYAPKTAKTAATRSPSRKKQTARGQRFDQMARSQAASARSAMKRGRRSAPGS